MNPVRPAGSLAVVALCLCGLSGCGPEFPAFWLIEPDPLNASSEVDPAGKLRVLAVRAEPPEAAPGSKVTLQSLVAIHPQQGLVAALDGQSVHTTQPPGIGALWFVCREPESQVSPQPCGLGPVGTWFDLQPLPTTYTAFGPASELVVSTVPGEMLPASRIVTMIVADAALPGGAAACFASAMQNQGVVPDANHCLITVKRIRVSMSQAPNHNPEIAKLWFGPSVEMLGELAATAGNYPLLDPATADDDRPKLIFGVERGVDSVETGTDKDGNPQDETLSATVFVTGGTLEAGRGSFLDLACAETSPDACPRLLRSDVSWQPPAARASIEAPEQRVYFFAVLRDDRGGLSFRRAAVAGR